MFRLPNIIKFFAILTALPRWMGALVAAEGYLLPINNTWMWFSIVSSAGMAVVEALAFSYMFTAWRNQKDKSSNYILYLALASALLFSVIVTPYIVSQVSATPMRIVLQGPLLYLWSGSVALSTIVIVAGVGVAEKSRTVRKPEPEDLVVPTYPKVLKTLELPKPSFVCSICGATAMRNGKPFANYQALAAHTGSHTKRDSINITKDVSVVGD